VAKTVTTRLDGRRDRRAGTDSLSEAACHRQRSWNAVKTQIPYWLPAASDLQGGRWHIVRFIKAGDVPLATHLHAHTLVATIVYSGAVGICHHNQAADNLAYVANSGGIMAWTRSLEIYGRSVRLLYLSKGTPQRLCKLMIKSRRAVTGGKDNMGDNSL